MEWLTDLVRSIFFGLDSIVYGFITQLYELLMYLANIQFNNDLVNSFVSRIYTILGIFMLFRVAFSVLQYIVNPDSFSDSSQGMGKMVTNILIALILLVLTPTIFDWAFELQSIILKNNVIGNLILGNSVSSDTVEISNATMAEDMEFLVFGSFFQVNTDVIGECGDGDGTDGSANPVLGTKAMAADTACLDKVTEVLNNNNVDINDFFRTSSDPNDTTGAYERNFASFGDITNARDGTQYYFNYQYIISTAAGVVIVFMLLSYCIDVAVRVFKLFFLEIIAPIPVISYVDPKQGKDGMLSRWGKECGSTYASLFIRLAVIYLAFFLIDVIASSIFGSATYIEYANEQTPTGDAATLVYVMLIIGVLIFAGQVPKLIEDLFGIKGSGSLGINPLKRISDSPVAAATLGSAGAALGAGVGSTASNLFAAGSERMSETMKHVKAGEGLNWRYKQAKQASAEADTLLGKAKVWGSWAGNKGKFFAGGLASGFAGGVSGTARGAKAGFTSKSATKGAGAGIKGSNDARYTRDINQQADYGLGNRVLDRVRGAAGVKNKDSGVGRMDAQIKANKRMMDNYQTQEAALRQSLLDHSNKYKSAYSEVTAKQRDANGNILLDAAGNEKYQFANYDASGNFQNFDYGKYEAWYRGHDANWRDQHSEFRQTEFNEYMVGNQDLERQIKEVDEAYETLRQENSRLQDASDARKKAQSNTATKTNNPSK